MKICILGGGGCFAINAAQYLLQQGHEVIGIGRSMLNPIFSQGIEHTKYRYHVYLIGPDNEFIMDLLDRERPEVIVNYAAQGEGAASFRPFSHWKYFYQTNAVALVDMVARLAQKPYLKRFVHIGTSELYGPCDRAMKETDPIQPTSPYAASKAAFDLHLLSIYKALGFPMNIIRPSNCYVAGQQLHRIIPKALLYAATKRKLPLHGGGKAEKSYLHAYDLSTALHRVIQDAPMGEVYNVGPDAPTSIREVVERCAATAGVSFDDLCEIAGEREGQDSRYWLDCTKIKALGWSQRVSWGDGLTETHHWILSNLDALAARSDAFRMRA